MFSPKKVTIIIADEVVLPENIINLIEQRQYQQLEQPCIWHRLNDSFKIKSKYFNAKVFAKYETTITSHRLMRADPIFVQAGLNGAVVMNNKLTDLSPNQANKIGAAIKPDLRDFGLKLEIASPNRWYVFGDNVPEFDVSPTLCIKEQKLQTYQDKNLNQLANQLQVTLYNLKINQQRAQNRQPEINSLWFWGACDFKSRQVKAKFNQILFADDEEIMMYAKYFKIKLNPLSKIKPDISNALIVINHNPEADIWQAIANIQNKNLSFEYRGICYQ